MAKRIEPNAHPSGARIEKMIMNAEKDMARKKSSNVSGKSKRTQAARRPEKGSYGEALRSSEQENRYISPEEPAEGARDAVPAAPHHMDVENREDR